MKTILYKAETRGYFDHGWLKTHHTFSFAEYYDPERIHFGLLRVFNDDIIDNDEGFGTHFHDNMEIITVPLRGALEHKDSTGTSQLIQTNDVQVMSAGAGIYHSEYSRSGFEDSNIFQIWVFPKKKNVAPRYDQLSFDPMLWKNKFFEMVKPEGNDGLWINQDAYVVRGDFDKNTKVTYNLKSNQNGVYLFVIEGAITIGDKQLLNRDSIGIYDTEEFSFNTIDNSQLLLIEVPMR
jgi:quercetin 2,3-dioxygenase